MQYNMQGDENLLCSRKPTLPSNPLPVLEKYIRKWHHSNRQECQETRGPLIAESVVHLDPEQRERR